MEACSCPWIDVIVFLQREGVKVLLASAKQTP
jgi:hypothetical protein